MFLTLLSPQGTPPPAPQVVLPKVVKPWVKVDGTWKNSKIWVKKQNGWHITAPSLKISDSWLSSDFINPDYKAAVLADTPTGFWPLTEANPITSIAEDVSGNNLDATYQRFGMIDDANWKSFPAPRFLGGTNDWVSIPANTNLSSHAGSTGSWSFDAMLYDNGSSGHRVILSVSEFPPAEYEVFIYRTSGGNIIADITQSDGTSITSITVPKPPDKKWYHFAYTYDRDAAVAKIYIDGVEVGSDTTMSGVSAYTANVWRLGGRGDDSGDRWSGRMSHAAIYPAALTASQVKLHADSSNNIVLPENYSNFTSTTGWARSGAPSFSGGIESTINISGTDYRVHTFTSSGTLNMLKGGTVEYLVVGGGGAGGSHNNAGLGGGGAGGLLTGSVNLTAMQAITVGAGGVAIFNEDGGDGGNSSIGSLFVAIGGGGGAGPIPGNGRSGGSGGGASNWRASYGGAGSGTSGQGYAGGNSDFIGGRGSGGGGAGGAGGDGTNFEAGNGGIGVSSSISGNAVTYAGGGGGGGTGAGGSGGSGGGGIGATPGYGPGTGAANTGSGGGGGYVSEGGNGGSGIVIVRYAI